MGSGSFPGCGFGLGALHAREPAPPPQPASAQGPRPPEPGACPAAGPLMHLPRCLRPPPPRGAPGVPRGTSAHFPGTPWPAVPPPLPPRRSRFVTATLADEQTAQQSRATGAPTGAEPWLRASAKPVPGHRGAATADRRAECGPSTADCPPDAQRPRAARRPRNTPLSGRKRLRAHGSVHGRGPEQARPGDGTEQRCPGREGGRGDCGGDGVPFRARDKALDPDGGTSAQLRECATCHRRVRFLVVKMIHLCYVYFTVIKKISP